MGRTGTWRRRRAAPDREAARAVDSVAIDVDLHRALRRLPRRQRDVVLLRYFADLTEQEIAAELGLAPGTVKSHASRGLHALRNMLDDKDVAPQANLQREDLR